MVSVIAEKSCVVDIDNEPVKPVNLRYGPTCYWLKWDNDWSGEGDDRPVNPMHLREDTSCLSLEWKNHCGGGWSKNSLTCYWCF